MPSIRCKNILVVRTDRIGDVVLTTPVLKALRVAYPTAKIMVFVAKSTADLVRGNPYIDGVIVDDRKGEHKGWLGMLRLARQIRQGQFDTAFIFHTKRRYNLLCFLAGITQRVGFQGGKFSFFLTHPMKDTRHLGQMHEAEYCLDLLKFVGIKDAGLDVFVPVNKEAEGWAIDWLKSNSIHPGQLIAIHPGASDPTRLWPVACYAQLIDALTNQYALKFVLIGGKETAAVAAEIKRLSHSSILDLTGQATILQSSSILRRSRLLISSDSGPLHIASGVGIYVICLFPRNQPGINPTRWKALGSKAFLLVNKPGEEIILDRHGSIISGKLDSITVEDVSRVVGQILTQDNQSLFHW